MALRHLLNLFTVEKKGAKQKVALKHDLFLNKPKDIGKEKDQNDKEVTYP